MSDSDSEIRKSLTKSTRATCHFGDPKNDIVNDEFSSPCRILFARHIENAGFEDSEEEE